MSDSIRFSTDGSTVVNGITVNTPYESSSDKSVSVEDFLQLMVAQLTNQDFLDPVDDTQYVTQLAQFATMQSMQELSYYSQSNSALSLVGKNVTAASYGVGGAVNKEVGVVSRVNFSGKEFTFTVNGKEFTMSQLMYVNDFSSSVSKNELAGARNMFLITKEVGQNNVSIRWEAPISDKDKMADLVYDVYYTTDESVNFNDLAAVKKGTNAITGLKDPEYELKGLEPGTTYYVNVVVRNSNGDENVYKSSEISTKEES